MMKRPRLVRPRKPKKPQRPKKAGQEDLVPVPGEPIALEQAQVLANSNKDLALTVGRRAITERPEAGKALADVLPNIADGETQTIGEYRGFILQVANTPDGYRLILRNPATGVDHSGNPVPSKDVTPAGLVQRLENLLTGLTNKIEQNRRNLQQSETSLRTYQEQINKPFPDQERLQAMTVELAQLEKRLQGEPAAVPA